MSLFTTATMPLEVSTITSSPLPAGQYPKGMSPLAAATASRSQQSPSTRITAALAKLLATAPVEMMQED